MNKTITALVNFVYVDDKFNWVKFFIVLANLFLLFITVLVALSVV